MKSNQLPHNGFVILFTILISSIIMVIGLGIFSIALRESILSGSAREAQYAFYAADAGVECALYGQTITPDTSNPFFGSGNSFECGATNGSPNTVTSIGPAPMFTFDVMVDRTIGTCAHVTVMDGAASPLGNPTRRILSQGYNLCDPNTSKPVNPPDPRLVERDLDTSYEIAPTP